MKVVWLCLVNSTYFSDSLTHIECVFDSYNKALNWKNTYEAEVEKNFGLTLPRIKNGTDAELDKYLQVQTELEKSKKFLSCEIKEFSVR